MGTFSGHALPGSFLLIFGVWWTIAQFHRYYGSRLKNGAPYRNTATFRFFFLPGWAGTWESEGFLKIFFAVIGITAEVVTATEQGQFVHLGNGQHATMIFFFGMSGLIDLLLHHNIPLPKSLSYVCIVLAFLVELILFNFHLHGRNELDVVLHTLLLYVIALDIVTTLVELHYSQSLLAGLARSYFITLQGTWFWQVGFILYNPFGPSWPSDSHDQITIATIVFGWHMGGVFVTQLLIGGVVACVYRCRGQLEEGIGYNLLHIQLLPKEVNGHVVVNLNEDSDSDDELQGTPPQTDHHRHHCVWLHMGGVFMTQLLIGGVVVCVHRCRGQLDDGGYDLLHMQQLLPKEVNGHVVVNLNEGSNSDAELQGMNPHTGDQFTLFTRDLIRHQNESE